MATRKEVNDLYQQYLGRDATKEGLDYWTSQGLSLSGIEYNIANSPEAQAKVSTSITIGDIPVNLGLFTGNVTSPFKFPTDLLRDELTQGKFFQQFIDFFRPYVEGQDVDDPDRINRANEASRWLELLGKYAEGNATEEDLKNFDAEFLSEIPAWKDYFEGLVGSTDTGTGEDAEARTRADQLAGDLNNALGGVGNEQQISEYLYSQLAPGSPLPEGTTGPVVGIDFDCLNTRGWKECTTLGMILKIPGIPQLPAAILGTIFRDKTIQEIEDMIKEGVQDVKDIIQDVKDIFDPNVESQIVNKVLTKVGEVRDQVKDIFDGDGNGEVTTKDIDEVLGGVGGAILQGAYGVLINTGKNEIEKVLGLPPGTLLTSDNSSSESCYAKGFQVAEDGSSKWDCSDLELGQDRRCLDDDFAKDPQNKAICGEYVPQVIKESELFGTGGVGGDDDITKISDDLTKCSDGVTDPDENGRCPEDYCADGSLKFTHPFGICPSGEGPDDTTYTKPTVNCKQPKVGFSPSFDPTASAKYAEYSAEYDAACAGGTATTNTGTTSSTTYVAPTVNCSQPKVGFSPSFDPTATAKYAEYSESYDATCLSGGGSSGGGGNGEDQCTGGKVRVNDECVCPSGTTENVNGQCVSVGGGDDTTSTGGGPTFNCISQNRKTNEDGSCGECLPGYVLDPDGFDQCVKDDTVITGGPEPEVVVPSTSSGGSGGVGGGAGGMFTGTVSGLSYMPQALPGIQTPPPVNAMASIESLIGRMLTGNIS